MKVVFRCDASRLIGTGHVVRCVTLAQELRRRGVAVRFICRSHEGSLASRLAEELMPVSWLAAPDAPMKATAGADAYATWRGVSIEQDAAETIAVLADGKPDWLIVDHYGLDVAWERALRPHCVRLLAIDDLTDRNHACDVLLNQNHGAGEAALTAEGKRLLGTRYALLRPEYAQARALKTPDASGEVRRVVVFFGGVDAEDLTGRALRAMSSDRFKELDVDLVVGANYPHRVALAAAAAARGRACLHGGRAHLADLLARADLAIGAGGSATWERLCVGVPSILVAVSENQLGACRSLSRDGVASYLGPLAEFSDTMLAAEIARLIDAPRDRERMAAAGRELVDGLGVVRVAEALLPTAESVWATRHESPRRFRLHAGTLPLAEIGFENGADEDRVTARVLEPDLADGAVARLLFDSLRMRRAASHPARPMSAATASATGRRIAVLSDASSWLNPALATLVLGWLQDGHVVEWAHRVGELTSGDFCFLLGCGQLVPSATRARFRHTLVVHESALPHGKGWSPLTWQVLEGRATIPVTLLEAVDRLDSGVIYAQQSISLRGDELVEELRRQQAGVTLALCREFVRGYPDTAARAREQTGEESFYARRRPEDSRLDPQRTLAEQFNQFRVADNERYPAFFDYRGRRYRLAITAA